MKVVYLPLDSRPCNWRFPVELLRNAGITCVVPPLADMDSFVTPSDYGTIASFCMREAADADTLILSVEQLVYGSLLASREDTVSLEEAEARLDLVRQLRQAYPHLKIIAFGVVMRATISALGRDDLRCYEAFVRYSQAAHRVQLGDEAAEAEMAAAKADIPAERLASYHRVRDRNHAINRMCVDFVAEGAIDRLLLLQEDAQPFGFHRMEQAALLTHIQALRVEDRITLHNGTDEGGCLCAAAVAGQRIALYVHMLDGASGAFVAKYEDRPFIENIRSHCRFAGIALADMEDADCVLCVLGPGEGGQQDIVAPEDVPQAERERQRALAAEVAGLMREGRRVALLDVCYANGGAVHFMNALAELADPLALCGYAAWNTASNALGTVLAQIALCVDAEGNRRFTLERLLDDLLYQSVVRFQLRDALEKHGEDTLRLSAHAEANEMLQQLMHKAVAASPVLARYAIEAAYTLPWPRIFEADVALQRFYPKSQIRNK